MVKKHLLKLQVCLFSIFCALSVLVANSSPSPAKDPDNQVHNRVDNRLDNTVSPNTVDAPLAPDLPDTEEIPAELEDAAFTYENFSSTFTYEPGLDNIDFHENFEGFTKKVRDANIIKIADFSVLLGASCNIEQTDNLLFSENNRKSDTVFRPFAWARVERMFLENATLKLGSRLGYTKYLNHSQYDDTYFIISPDTHITIPFRFRNIFFTLEDALYHQQDPASSTIADNQILYKRTTNLLRLNAEVKTDPLNYLLSVAQENFIVHSRDFKSQGKTVRYYSAGIMYPINDDFRTGLRAAHSTEHYRKKIQNDSKSNSIGVESRLTLANRLQGTWFLGYESRRYKKTGAINDNSKSKSWVTQLEVLHALSPYASHRLGVQVAPQNGFGTNFFDYQRYRYLINYAFSKFIGVSSEAFLERMKDSNVTGSLARSHRTGLTLGMNLVPLEHGSIDLSYRHLKKHSKVQGKGYRENRFTFTVTYVF